MAPIPAFIPVDVPTATHDLLAAGADPRQLADALKAEAERQNFIVPRRALPIAARIERLGVLVADPGITALGALARADSSRDQGRYPDALREDDRAGASYLSVLVDAGWARTRLGSTYPRGNTLEP